MAGLEQVIEYIENLHFEPEDLEYLKSTGLFGDDFLEYLSGFRFTGDIYAIPEGSVIFPREPLVKVIAPIMQAQLIEPDRHQDLPHRPRSPRGRRYGIRSEACAGTGCGDLRCTRGYDCRMHRHLQCPLRADV